MRKAWLIAIILLVVASAVVVVTEPAGGPGSAIYRVALESSPMLLVLEAAWWLGVGLLAYRRLKR